MPGSPGGIPPSAQSRESRGANCGTNQIKGSNQGIDTPGSPARAVLCLGEDSSDVASPQPRLGSPEPRAGHRAELAGKSLVKILGFERQAQPQKPRPGAARALEDLPEEEGAALAGQRAGCL